VYFCHTELFLIVILHHMNLNMQVSVIVTSYVILQFMLHDKNDHYVGYELLAVLRQSYFFIVLFIVVFNHHNLNYISHYL
jgi:hypothetical protein